MKKIFVLTILICITFTVNAQSPQFGFKVSVKNNDGLKYRINAQLWSFSTGYQNKVLKNLDKIIIPDSMKDKYKILTSENSGLNYDNQLFVNDDVIAVNIFRVTENREELMTIAFPILDFSWGTFVSLENIDFIPGYFEPEFNYNQKTPTVLNISIAPAYEWRSLNPSDRKIILP